MGYWIFSARGPSRSAVGLVTSTAVCANTSSAGLKKYPVPHFRGCLPKVKKTESFQVNFEYSDQTVKSGTVMVDAVGPVPVVICCTKG